MRRCVYGEAVRVGRGGRAGGLGGQNKTRSTESKLVAQTWSEALAAASSTWSGRQTTMDAISTFAGGVAQAVGFDADGSSDTLGKKTDKTYVATDVLMVENSQKQPYAVLVVDPTKRKKGTYSADKALPVVTRSNDDGRFFVCTVKPATSLRDGMVVPMIPIVQTSTRHCCAGVPAVQWAVGLRRFSSAVR